MEYTSIRDDFRTYLQLEYTKRCQKNSHYSLRSFAKKLEIDPSSLSQFLRNKRNLSEKKMKDIGKKLNLSPEDFLKFVSTGDQENYQLIKLDHFSLLSNWYHLAICQLSLLNDFSPSAQWIAKRLDIQVAEAQAAIDRLIRIGWMEQVDGNLLYVGGNMSTVDTDITSRALKDYQSQMLDKAKESMEDIPLHLRSNTGMTMAIDKSKLEQAQAMIGQFRRKISDFLEDSENKDEVYHISISLFPLTNIEDIQ